MKIERNSRIKSKKNPSNHHWVKNLRDFQWNSIKILVFDPQARENNFIFTLLAATRGSSQLRSLILDQLVATWLLSLVNKSKFRFNVRQTNPRWKKQSKDKLPDFFLQVSLMCVCSLRTADLSTIWLRFVPPSVKLFCLLLLLLGRGKSLLQSLLNSKASYYSGRFFWSRSKSRLSRASNRACEDNQETSSVISTNCLFATWT